jgi:regulator of sigma E protease
MSAMSWVLTILGIVLLIVLHELGHFTVAKLVGMRVERFSLFFPPTIARFRRGETEYAIGAIPAGGYVKITGMNPEELEDLDPEATRRAYYSQPPWKRIVVILAGPGVNILIAFVLFWAILLSGNINGSLSLNNLDPSLNSVTADTSVLVVEHGAPASGALRQGDRIVAVDGRPVTVASARRLIEAHPCAGKLTEGCKAATPVRLTVRRDGKALTLSLYPRYDAQAKRMRVGVAFGSIKHYGVLAAAGASIGTMWHATWGTLTGFAKALTSSKTRGEVSSIVGITKTAHETVVEGSGLALTFLGYISLVLAVINLFPFLPLDGGHIFWALAEKVRGKRIPFSIMEKASLVGVALVLVLFVIGLTNDIHTFSHGGFGMH